MIPIGYNKNNKVSLNPLEADLVEAIKLNSMIKNNKIHGESSLNKTRGEAVEEIEDSLNKENEVTEEIEETEETEMKNKMAIMDLEATEEIVTGGEVMETKIDQVKEISIIILITEKAVANEEVIEEIVKVIDKETQLEVVGGEIEKAEKGKEVDGKVIEKREADIKEIDKVETLEIMDSKEEILKEGTMEMKMETKDIIEMVEMVEVAEIIMKTKIIKEIRLNPQWLITKLKIKQINQN